jgi:CRP-like cAMP-binding protein
VDKSTKQNGSRPVIDASVWPALLGGAAAEMPELLHEIEALSALRRIDVGASVLSRQLAATELVAVVDGVVGLGLQTSEGFQLERSVRAPQWLDLSSAWLGAGYAQDARVVERATVLYLPVAPLNALLQREPALQLGLTQALARQVHRLTAATQELMHKGAEKRLAAWLLQHHRQSAVNGSALVHLSERKRDIAAQLAIAPETLSRRMRELKRKGLIEVQGYRVQLLDLPALQREAAAH